MFIDKKFDFKETKEVEIREESNDLVPKTSYQQIPTEESHRSDDQKLQDNAQQQSTSNSGLLGSRGLISRFENSPSPSLPTTKESLTNLSATSPPPSSSLTSRNIRSQSQDPSRKSLTVTASLPPSNPNTVMNGMASSTPFSVKKDSKENTALPTGISTTNNDASAIKRVIFHFDLFNNFIGLFVLLNSYMMMLNVKSMN